MARTSTALSLAAGDSQHRSTRRVVLRMTSVPVEALRPGTRATVEL